MKRITYTFVAICLLGATLFSYCTAKKNEVGAERAMAAVKFDTVYNVEGYILLKAVADSSINDNKEFAPDSVMRSHPLRHFGIKIPDDQAEEQIRNYRRTIDPTIQTRYIDLNFLNLFWYLRECKNSLGIKRSDLGLRIYPGIKKGTNGQDSLTIVISPTCDNKALWRQTISEDVYHMNMDVNAFNSGSLCPVNCLDSDDDKLNFDNNPSPQARKKNKLKK